MSFSSTPLLVSKPQGYHSIVSPSPLAPGSHLSPPHHAPSPGSVSPSPPPTLPSALHPAAMRFFRSQNQDASMNDQDEPSSPQVLFDYSRQFIQELWRTSNTSLVPLQNLQIAPKPRLLSLDIFRGLALVSMIIANYQIEDSAFSLLLHADWIGLTLADLVFPSFIFICGVAVPLSFYIREHDSKTIFVRSLWLFLIGMLFNAVPSLISQSWVSYRPLGVLQRIAIVYLVCALTYKHLSWFAFRWIVPVVLIVSWLYLSLLLPLPECNPTQSLQIVLDLDLEHRWAPPECTSQSFIDRLVFGQSHLYGGHVFDNEGILSTLMAILTGWIGVLVGVGLLRCLHVDYTDGRWRIKVMQKMVASGLIFIIVGTILNQLGWIPVSKNLWSLSFVLVSGGISLMLLTLIYVIADYSDFKYGSTPFVALGRNSLLIYICSECVAWTTTTITLSDGPDSESRATLWLWLFRNLGFATHLPAGWNSLIWSLAWCLLVFIPFAIYMKHKKYFVRL
ncbi:uncharacterized protein BJ171DRAFT_180359 [Polychytrium aggregatum]|uniref:uncharacterized protein n=1 Tax=Polychytrium aggregatum TaxID=110093 RepID=UPI0022FECBAA|nr:uncharacterized protein BJ171DRAFT_180359 [Polychytrium aggregatum]KAI9202443.1 hypothetical protein BJ171DRAFT_180359 [Polychytrium aggregatum]